MKLNTAWLNVWTRLFNYPDETLEMKEGELTSHRILTRQRAEQCNPEAEIVVTGKEKYQDNSAKLLMREHASEVLSTERESSCSKPFILSLDGDLV